MVTYCATKLTATYLAMIGQIFDTMSLPSTNIFGVVIMTLQNLCLGKCWKLFQAPCSVYVYIYVFYLNHIFFINTAV